MVQTWLEKGEDRPTLVFGVNRAHALRLSEEFIAAGVAAAYVDGTVDGVMRGRIADQFRAGEVRVICSVRTMTTGVDLPVSCICDAAPTRSEMLHCQKIGRGLRVNPGTEDLVVFDHAGNSLRLGLITDIHHADLDRSRPGERRQAALGPRGCRRPARAVARSTRAVSALPVAGSVGGSRASRRPTGIWSRSPVEGSRRACDRSRPSGSPA